MIGVGGEVEVVSGIWGWLKKWRKTGEKGNFVEKGGWFIGGGGKV